MEPSFSRNPAAFDRQTKAAKICTMTSIIDIKFWNAVISLSRNG
jgi:hypothetical protein